MIVAVCADKGSPGVSTVATALAMVWPGERLLLEADTSGGDAALRMRTPAGGLLARSPGLRGLCVDVRDGGPVVMSGYAQQTSVGVPVIAAADLRTEDFARLAGQWPSVASAAAAWPGTVVADLGRLSESSPSGWLAAAAAVVLVVGRSTPESMYHLTERVRALGVQLGRDSAARLAAVVVCPQREHAGRMRELTQLLAAHAETAAVPVAGWIAEDRRGVQTLRDGQTGKRLAGSDLLRSTSRMAELLVSWCPQPAAVPEPTTAPTGRPVLAADGGMWS